MNLKKYSLQFAAIFMVMAAGFLSCQKELSGDSFIPTLNTPPDLVTEVTASSISGFVTDEANVAISAASVRVGSLTASTNKYGYFEVKNARVVQNAALVVVSKPGYFSGFKTYIATSGKGAFFRISLIAKNVEGTFSGSTGGVVTLSNGLTITFPASAVVVAGSNTPYGGTVNVAAHWINPTAANLEQVMPGDLRGLDTTGQLKTLTTFGMAAVEMTGSAGELLQIDSNKTATLTIPIPSSLMGNAPASLPLWYFNENIGLWKQEGFATKTGSTYVGAVKHFSFWNCDVPNNFIRFECNVVDPTGRPVANALVKIYQLNNPTNIRYGYTDTSGYVAGAVPKNASLVMEVYSDPSCLNFLVTRSFVTTDVNLNLGNITIPAINYATISGNVVNCTGAAVTDGYVIMNKSGVNYFAAVDNTGAFSFQTSLCDVTVSATFVAQDNVAMQQSALLSRSIVTGVNAIGTLSACGTSTAQFVNYSINGASYSFVAPADSIIHSGSVATGGNNSIYSYRRTGGVNAFVNLSFTNTAMAVGTPQNLLNFSSNQLGDSTRIITNILVNITEYGAVGQFISGDFTGTLTGAPPANIPYNVTCNFRVRRNN